MRSLAIQKLFRHFVGAFETSTYRRKARRGAAREGELGVAATVNLLYLHRAIRVQTKSIY